MTCDIFIIAIQCVQVNLLPSKHTKKCYYYFVNRPWLVKPSRMFIKLGRLDLETRQG
jgi:hypothetical protein